MNACIRVMCITYACFQHWTWMRGALLRSACLAVMCAQTCCFRRENKSRSSTFKTTDFSTLKNQPAITSCLGQQTPTVPPLHRPMNTHTHSDRKIHSIQIHIWSNLCFYITVMKKVGIHRTNQELFPCKQASQARRRSVIISTMTVRVLHSAIQGDVYCLVKLPVCSCVTLICITDHNAAAGLCLPVKGTGW